MWPKSAFTSEQRHEKELTYWRRAAATFLFRDTAIHYFSGYSILLETKMAKKAGNNDNRSKSEVFGSVVWVNVQLSETDKSHMGASGFTADDVLARVEDAVYAHHSVSVRSTRDGDGYSASMVATSSESPNYGKGLSGYGKTPAHALYSLMYKHFVICNGVWPDATQRNVSDFG